MNMNKYLARIKDSKLLWPLAIIGLVLLFDLFFVPGFFHLEIKDGRLFGSLVDILNRGAPLMLISLGMTLVIATGGIDISVGPVAAIAGAMAAFLIGGESFTNTPLPLVIVLSLLAAALCGVWNGLLVSRAGIQPIVATLILFYAGRGIAQMITQGQILTIYYRPFYYVGGGHLLGLPFSIFLVALVFIALKLLLRRTAIGMFIESVGINSSSSFYSGVDEKNIKLLAYTICSLCAGVAGLVLMSNIKGADANNTGLLIELDAILAVVIGGTLLTGGRVSLLGSLLGALIIQGLTTSMYSFGVPPTVVYVAKAGVVFAISLLQSAKFREAITRPFVSKRKVAK